MTSSIKILIAVIVTGLLTFFVTREFCPGYEVVESTSDTTKTVTEKISTDENTFTAEQVGNIKKVLVDSLSENYKNKIAAYHKYWRDNHSLGGDTSTRPSDSLSMTEPCYVYLSEIDSNFAAKDSAGNVTDSIQVASTFISPEPLPESSIHLLSINHKSFTKTIEKETTITNTDVVEKKKSFLENFQLSPSIGAGYGFIHKQFDVYAGVGLRYEFDFISIF